MGWGVTFTPLRADALGSSPHICGRCPSPPLGTPCHRVRIMASIVVRVGVRVRVSGGSGGLKNTRITEMTQQFILVWDNRCPTSSS
jgi:hypothetical protein